MSLSYVDLFAIERPVILMNAAKQFLLSSSNSKIRVKDEKIDEMISQEKQLEQKRRSSDLSYDSKSHIALLANLIEQAQILYREGKY